MGNLGVKIREDVQKKGTSFDGAEEGDASPGI
jgi:hypothetical protein